ncbi:MAG: hypothetical protein IPM35_33475 [Myxococcales bacterium]|nr:hypothetical protein [Myxococcales bacterium]
MGYGAANGVWTAGLIAALALPACGEQPSKVAGAPSTPPSESYRLESGEAEGFLWYCVGGERVRMSRACRGDRCGNWLIARGPCGHPMPDEPPPVARRPMIGAGWW